MHKRFVIKLLTLVLIAFTLDSCSQYKVYSVKDNPNLQIGGGVMYALPKTQLCVAVTVERRDLSKAPYSAYAIDYLGVDPSAIDTSFQIVDIDVSGRNVADPDYFYYVKVRRGSVSVDNNHLLLTIGMDAQAAAPQQDTQKKPSATKVKSETRPEYNLYDHADTLYTRFDMPGYPTMVSTRKDVRSIKQRAAAAAERLDEVQTKKQELLNGEYEGSYGSESVQYLFSQLDRQEREIVASFCGTVRRETVTFYVDPVMKRKEDFTDTVVWFSPQTGFSYEADSLDEGVFPIVCTVHSDNTMRSANRFVRYHTSGVTSNSAAGHTGKAASKFRSRKSFRYRIPEQAKVDVFTPLYSVSRSVPLSQLGPIVELPRFSITAIFDPVTHDLIKLERRQASTMTF